MRRIHFLELFGRNRYKLKSVTSRGLREFLEKVLNFVKKAVDGYV
ncbi:hypothetical protein [Magnetospirillum molischianum]|uniref:Uncharacterized protein n=1 Tax=Magnetospirillum molischianum DSM 120 TaxID=1150626 RepID=H8FPX8_MAGML|nr:hypothetical protein [Magnetospirillum molischianum]CCG40416.1 hypothetical protein PHAMO_20102 [Magnetospirillum molischianum DSM 120]